MLSLRTSVAASIVVGIVLELGVQALSARREAWDSPAFWTIGLPCALVAALLIGVWSSGRAWLSTFAVAPAQFLAMTIRSGEIGIFWPLGLALTTLLSLPFVAASFAGSRLGRAARRRRTSGSADVRF